MDVIEQLRARSPRFVWANGIRVDTIPGRGNSVVCTAAVAAHQVIIRIPPDLLINVDTASPHQGSDADVEWTAHEILACELLARKKRSGEDLWVESLPPDFDSMPVSWPAPERQLAPNQRKIATQLREIDAFADKLTGSFGPDECAWAWKAVNTRCLYWHHGGMTLAPAVDYLNHTPLAKDALKVESDFRGITVTTQRAYQRGEELTFSYGPHDNAFLLVEYGFIVEPNMWDFVDVTSALESRLTEPWRRWLQEKGYWQEYTIDRDGQPSFRTEVALAACQPEASENVLGNMIAGYDDGGRFQTASARLLREIARGMIADMRNIKSKRSDLVALLAIHVSILEKV